MKKDSVRTACIQLNAGDDWKKNWRNTEKQLLEAVRHRADFAVLPENFIARAAENKMTTVVNEAVPAVLARLRQFSKKHGITLVAGSVPELLPQKRGKTASTCFVFSPKGVKLLSYRKMHLFDIDVPGMRVRESQWIHAGKKPGFFKINGMKIGVGICYDLRFPEYFRVLSKMGAEILLVPANFTAETGKTAWEVLLRARAIENQCYVAAAGQCGLHPGSGIRSFGNSMVIDPLGKVLKRASFSKPGVLIADLNLKSLRAWRRQLPALKHRKISCF